MAFPLPSSTNGECAGSPRIAPALILVILATIPFAWVLFDPVQLKDFGQSVACATLFCANVLFWSEADYFAHAAEL